MTRFSTFSVGAVALAMLAGGGGYLGAQRLYRGVELPPPNELAEPMDGDEPSEFVFARLIYTDPYVGQELSERPWHIDSPAAERHFLQGLRRLSNVNARSKEHYVHPTDEDFFDYPWIYSVEAGYWDLTEEESNKIREYLLRGGFLVLDDFHGTVEWAQFLAGVRTIFPDRPIVDVGADHEAFHTLYDAEPGEQIPGVQMLYTKQTFERDGIEPQWKGIFDDEGRLMVLINFNMDLGDAWEHADWPEYPERYTAMAYRMGINYILYSMTH